MTSLQKRREQQRIKTARWRKKKLKADPDFFRNVEACWRKKRLSEDPDFFKKDYQVHKQFERDRKIIYRAKIKAAVLSYYGNGVARCVMCGFDNVDALSIDHIHGGGRRHKDSLGMTVKGGGDEFYRWLIKQDYPDGFRTLCMNCQFLEMHRLKGQKWSSTGDPVITA